MPRGASGSQRSVQPISSIRRSALRWLQRVQDATQFSHTWAPPRLRGTTWSMVSADAPQLKHIALQLD